MNLGPKSRLQGVDARFEDIRHTVTEMSSGQFSLLEGNVSKEDCMSAVLRPSSWGTNAGLYLMRKPLNEMEIAMAHGCVSSVESDQSYEEIERQPEPKIDADVAQFLRKRANVLDSLISRRRFWEAKWRRKNRG